MLTLGKEKQQSHFLSPMTLCCYYYSLQDLIIQLMIYNQACGPIKMQDKIMNIKFHLCNLQSDVLLSFHLADTV